MKLEINNYRQDSTTHAKFKGEFHRRGWSGPVWRMKVSVRFCSFSWATGRITGHIPRLNTSLYLVLDKVVTLGGWKTKFLIWPSLPPKN